MVQRRISAELRHRRILRSHSVFKFDDQVWICWEDQNKFVSPFSVYGYDNEKTVYVITDKFSGFRWTKYGYFRLMNRSNKKSRNRTKMNFSFDIQWNFSSSSLDWWRTRGIWWNGYIFASIKCSVFNYSCLLFRLSCLGNGVWTIWSLEF